MILIIMHCVEGDAPLCGCNLGLPSTWNPEKRRYVRIEDIETEDIPSINCLVCRDIVMKKWIPTSRR